MSLCASSQRVMESRARLGTSGGHSCPLPRRRSPAFSSGRGALPYLLHPLASLPRLPGRACFLRGDSVIWDASRARLRSGPWFSSWPSRRPGKSLPWGPMCFSSHQRDGNGAAQRAASRQTPGEAHGSVPWGSLGGSCPPPRYKRLLLPEPKCGFRSSPLPVLMKNVFGGNRSI